MEMLSSILGAVPLDWLILGGILIGIALDTLKSGMGRAVAIAVSLPVTAFLFSLTESAFLLSAAGGFLNSAMMRLGLFAVLAGGMYFLVRRMGLDYIDVGHGAPVQALLTGAAATVVFVVVWLQIPLLTDFWRFSDQVNAVFLEPYRLIWLIGAYLALVFARG